MMGPRFPPWAAVALSGGTVEDLRKEQKEVSLRGASLLNIRFDRFAPSRSPESRARMGVVIVQTASFLKGRAVASITPERFGGAVSERDLPEPTRLDLLRTIASQGFQWVEVEDDIPSGLLMCLIEKAKGSGSKVVLSTRLRGGQRFNIPSEELLDACHGLKVYVDTAEPSVIEEVAEALRTILASKEDKEVFISPYGRYSSLVRMLAGMISSDGPFVDVGMTKRPDGPLPVQDDLPRFHSLISGSERTGGARATGPMTAVRGVDGLYLQLGGLGTTNFKFDMVNSAFIRLGEDRLMLPWESRPDDIFTALDLMRGMGALGAMVEAPLRTVSVPCMDWVDPRSKVTGSIDMVVGKEGRLYGYNTELYAISDIMKSEGATKGTKCLVLGTGSSGRAAAVGCSMVGLETVLVGGNLERTRSLATSLGPTVKGATLKALKRPALTFDRIICTVPSQQLNEMAGENDGMDLVRTLSSLRPSVGLDTTTVNGWTPFLAAVETCGGTPLRGSELMKRTTMRALSIWLKRQLQGPEVEGLLEGYLT